MEESSCHDCCYGAGDRERGEVGGAEEWGGAAEDFEDLPEVEDPCVSVSILERREEMGDVAYRFRSSPSPDLHSPGRRHCWL